MDVFKRISSGAFGLAILCFLLPFVSVSCSGQKIVTFTGLQLVTGTSFNEPKQHANQSKKIKAEPFAVLALASGIIGIGFTFSRSKKSAATAAALGAIGLVMLLILQSNLRDALLKEGGPLQLGIEIGYWLAALFYVAAAGLNGLVFLRNKDHAQIPP